MNWKRIFHLALPLALLVALTFRVDAYVFTDDFKAGHYWQSFPLGINRFIVESSDGPLLEDATRQAEEQWEAVIGKNLWDFAPIVLSSTYSGNHIRWSNNFGAETGYDPTRTLAVTIRYTSGTYLQKVVIILNGGMPQLKQNWAGVLNKTVLHEMGHVIGLDHSAEHSIMSAYISELSTLQQDDIDGGNAVVNETLYRQSIGYVAPSTADKSNSNASMLSGCGTIDLGNTGSGGGPAAFAMSLGLGVLLAFIIRRVKCLVTY